MALIPLISFLISTAESLSHIGLIVFEAVALLFPLVLGAYISISLMKVPDLSIETAFVVGAISGAKTLMYACDEGCSYALSIFPAMAASTVGGVMVGLLSSNLTHRAKFPHLLSSILTAGVFHGINQYWMSNSNISLSGFHNMMAAMPYFKRFPELPVLALLLFVFFAFGFFFLRTQLGTSFAVHGNNPRFFENYNISSRFVFITGLVVSNGLAGFAGFCDAQLSGFVDINMGALKALYCITSIILGKTLYRGKRPFSIWVPLLGSACYFAIIQGLLGIEFNLKFFTMVQSIIVASILIIKYQRSRSMTSHLGV